MALPNQPYGYPPGPPPQPSPPRQTTNGLAIAALVLGIVWVGWLGSLLAVIFGHIALYQINRTGAMGRGLAVAGLVLGYVGLAVLVILWLTVGLSALVSQGG
jgi:hypothetical protein